MHKKTDDTIYRLTEFAPLEAESKQTGGLFSRLFKRNNANDTSGQSKELKTAVNGQENGTKKSSNSAPASAYNSPNHRSSLSSPTHCSPYPSPTHQQSYPSPSQSYTNNPVSRRLSTSTSGNEEDSESREAKEMSEEQRRTLSSVMRRLGNILERRGQTPQAYKDSDFRQYWMPDSNCKQCYECGDRFTTFRRRHHCRICGQIFCSRCCNQEVPGKIMGYTVRMDDIQPGYLRVCTYCCKVVLNFAQNINTSGDVPSGLKENLQETRSKLENYQGNQGSHDHPPWVSPSGRRTKVTRVPSFYGEDLKLRSASELDLSGAHNPFDITPQSEYTNPQTILEERKAMLKDSVQLRELWFMIQDPYNGIELQSHRHRLRTYPNCIIGSELVDWLVAKDKATSRDQAVVIGQALVDASWLECITVQEQIFSDSYSLYKPGEAAISDVDSEVTTPQDLSFFEDDSEPQWFREINGESDSESETSSDLNKIPSTLSAPQLNNKDHGPLPRSQSVFYIESKSEGMESPHLGGQRSMRAKNRHSSGTTIQSFDSAPKLFETRGKTSYLARINSRGLEMEIAQAELEGFTVIGCRESPPALSGSASRISLDSHARGSSYLTDSVVSLDPQLGWQSLDNLREENGERLAYHRIYKVQWEHVTTLTRQLLNKEGLSFKWCEVIMAITHTVSKQVRPDVKHEHDDMDIRQYVQVKKIPGSSRSKTEIIAGVVCTKNIQHRKMRHSISSPRILLLRAAIEYQRVENKFSSLEPQILQEHEYLKNCVARIAALKPDILLVEKTVSRVAQEFILDTGITLVSNVKPSVLERVSRFTQADIVTSIDGLVSKTTLGFCTTFKVQHYKLADGRSKSLMYFDGCAHHLGCTVILRGGLVPELRKVKKILQFITYVAYHLRLELSYLMDSFALPPPHPDENMLDVSDTNSDIDNKSQVTFVIDSEESSVISSIKESPVPENVIVPFELPIEQRTLLSTQQQIHPEALNQQKETTQEQYLNTDQNINKTNVVLEQSAPVKQNTIEVGKTEEQSPFGLTGKSQLEVTESPFIRSSSNSSALKRFAEIKRHKRSVSDYAGESSSTVKASTEISDFSDPLQDYQRSKDESIFHKDNIKLQDDTKSSHNFKKALTDVTISVSPLLKFEVPYLETVAGSKCKLRQYFPQGVYWSAHLEQGSQRKNKGRSNQMSMDKTEDFSLNNKVNSEMCKSHEFMEKKLTVSIDDSSIQTMVADFRARGGRLISKHLAAYQNNLKKKSSTSPERNGIIKDTENQSDDMYETRVDCLDPANHQSIAVLFSSFSTEVNCSVYCVSPWVVTMDYYGRNDITLGGFLERYCFKESYHCPSETCDSSIVEHIRRFVHDNGCITVLLKKLDQPFPSFQNNILMWAWCRKCRQVTSVVPMSLDTWSMSFAKYLELHFYGNQYGRRASSEECVHNLHHDHFQYFGYKQIVASFKYSCLTLREISLPPIVITIIPVDIDVKSLEDQAKMLNYKGTTVFNAVVQSLLKLQHDQQYVNFIEDLEERELQLQSEQATYRKKIEVLSTMLEDLLSQKSKDRQSLLFVIQDLVLEIKRQIAKVVLLWNERFQDLDVQSKKANKSLSSQAKLNKASTVSMESAAMDISEAPASALPIKDTLSSASSSNTVTSNSAGTHSKNSPAGRTVTFEGSKSSPSDTVAREHSPPIFSLSDEDPSASIIVTEALADANPSHFGSPHHNSWIPQSLDSNSSGGSNSQGKESSLNTGGLSIEGNTRNEGKTRLSIDTPNTGTILGKDSTFDGSTDEDMVNIEMPEAAAVKADHKPKLEAESDKPKEKATGMKNIISSLLYNSGAIQIQMPFTADEHHLLPPCEHIPVIVYDEEPSSIIAYALSCQDYHDQLEDLKIQIANENNKSQNNKRPQSKGYDQSLATESFVVDTVDSSKGKVTGSKVLSFFKSASEGIEPVPKKAVELTGSGRFDGTSVKYTPKQEKDNLDDTDDTDLSMYSFDGEGKTNSVKAKQKEMEISHHIELQYQDSSAKFYCRVYFAEHFRKLRKLIFPEGEERFIRSLSRCYTWLASGGKSGSTFCKTQDDRFILKQMSKYEVQSFIEFGPHYFHYITKAHNEQKPTALAKILGVYKIGFKNTQNSASLKQDVLVMENLFYGRSITQIFDLKGSVRNRLVNTSGKRVEELVLLDENLLKLSLESPMYIRPHSKTVLTLAITNDTHFLSSHLVMDYSLLVGIDDNTKELVVGIIDYIRTFTWDKKIEMVVKSTYSHIGGQGKMPTVISPELYRSRFLEAMDRYFLHVPDRWTGLGQNVDC